VATHTIYIFTAAVPHNMQIKEAHRTVILRVVIHAVNFICHFKESTLAKDI
jgi:hypothetical protein